MRMTPLRWWSGRSARCVGGTCRKEIGRNPRHCAARDSAHFTRRRCTSCEVPTFGADSIDCQPMIGPTCRRVNEVDEIHTNARSMVNGVHEPKEVRRTTLVIVTSHI